MAETTLHPDPQAFPPGSKVKVYPRAEPDFPNLSGQPAGTEVEEATVAASGALVVKGLTVEAAYIGWRQSGGVDYYLRFRGPAAAAGGGGAPTGAAGGDLEGEYPNPTIGASKVVAAGIATDAVTEAKIKALAVTAAKLAAEAVTAAKIATNAVEEAKIKAEAVTAAKLAAGAVTTAKLGAEAVTAEKRTKVKVVERHTFSIDTVALKRYAGFFVKLAAGETATITRVDYELIEGTSATFELLKNGAALASYTALKAEKEHGEAASEKALADGDKIGIKVTAEAGSPKLLSVTVTILKEV